MKYGFVGTNVDFWKIFVLVLSILGLPGLNYTANADSITFDFNSLSDGSSNASIQSYMQTILNNNGLGTVVVSGAVAERNYTGDDHVVGGTFGGQYYSNTLGTSDGATGPLIGQRTPGQSGYYETFIVNNNFGSNNSDRITITLTLPVGYQLDSVSFDFEIFPNAACPGDAGTGHCNPIPDFTFAADGTVKLTQLASKPASGSGDNSPLSGSEKAWQFIGVSGLINVNDSDNVTKLEFIDWPAIVGIDNLTLNYHRPPERQSEPVPEPMSVFLLGVGLIALRKRLLNRHRHSEI